MMIPHSRPLHDAADEAAAVAALRSQMTATGEASRSLAEAVRLAFAGKYAATAASGTLALMMALRSLDVGEGDEVVLPTYVCAEVLDAVLYLKATPVLADIDPSTYSLSAPSVGAVRTPATRAVILPHMFGIAADVENIVELGTPVVEDLAQGLGCEYRGRPAGTWGAAAVLSFKAIKMLSTGEGGAVVVREAEAAARLENSQARRDPFTASYSFPMSDLAASVGLAQWQRLGAYVARRRTLARRYGERLRDLRRLGLWLPADEPGRSWFRYPVTLPGGVQPQRLKQLLGERGVQVRLPVDTLLHRTLGKSPADFPNAERVFGTTLSLPIYPALTEEQQDQVIAAFREVLTGQTGAPL